MNPFQEMAQNIKRSPHHKELMRWGSFLNERFGINHFVYYKIHLNGFYSCISTHQAWEEYSYATLCVKDFECLRHPECLQKGVNFMKTTKNKEFQKVLDTAWEKFTIH